MKASFACALVLLLSCLSALASPQKSQFKVKAAGGTTRTQVGDTLQLTLEPDVIAAIDKDCPPARPIIDQYGHDKLISVCPVNYSVTVQIKPVSIIGVTAGASAHYVGITWLGDRGLELLLFRASRRNYSSIVSFLEQVTGRKAANADAETGDHPVVALDTRHGVSQLEEYLPNMASDFKKVCPAVRIAGKDQAADFTVVLRKVSPTNPIPAAGGPSNIGGHNEALFSDSFDLPFTVAAIYDRNKRRISFSYGTSIRDTVMSDCTAITRVWGVHAQQTGSQSPAE